MKANPTNFLSYNTNPLAHRQEVIGLANKIKSATKLPNKGMRSTIKGILKTHSLTEIDEAYHVIRTVDRQLADEVLDCLHDTEKYRWLGGYRAMHHSDFKRLDESEGMAMTFERALTKKDREEYIENGFKRCRTLLRRSDRTLSRLKSSVVKNGMMVPSDLVTFHRSRKLNGDSAIDLLLECKHFIHRNQFVESVVMVIRMLGVSDDAMHRVLDAMEAADDGGERGQAKQFWNIQYYAGEHIPDSRQAMVNHHVMVYSMNMDQLTEELKASDQRLQNMMFLTQAIADRYVTYLEEKKDERRAKKEGC